MPSIVSTFSEQLPVPPLRGGAIKHWADSVSGYLSTLNNQMPIVSHPVGVAGHDGIEYLGITEIVDNDVDSMLVLLLIANNLSRVVANLLSDAPLKPRLDANARKKIKRKDTWMWLVSELNTVLRTSK